jgi:hypothetical protein
MSQFQSAITTQPQSARDAGDEVDALHRLDIEVVDEVLGLPETAASRAETDDESRLLASVGFLETVFRALGPAMGCRVHDARHYRRTRRSLGVVNRKIRREALRSSIAYFSRAYKPWTWKSH